MLQNDLHSQLSSLASDPSQADLPSELPNQIAPLAQLCSRPRYWLRSLLEHCCKYGCRMGYTAAFGSLVSLRYI